MKVTFYFDVFSWSKPGNVFASVDPSPKAEGCRRYRVDVEVPDPGDPDVVIEGKADVVG